MGFIDPALLEGARVIVRQAVTSAVGTAATSIASSTAPPTSPTMTSGGVPPTTTSSSAIVTGTDVSNGSNPGNSQQQGNNSSPLLFFVALGFGVVFTNLWIIVGVKYCFRYNARNRQMRLDENGEPINLENMPRPHRRRREKKLMTMEEVNEKFPMQKYKNWVASRAQEGLPTHGGVSVPPSRAGSVRSADGIVPDLPSKERVSGDQRPATSLDANASLEKHQPAVQTEEGTSTVAPPLTLAADGTQASSFAADAPPVLVRASQDEEEDDEHINAALPPDCMGSVGDACAICIDTLEDDDDVRGLTCGHAFHAVCLDPWLTSRRACCPLCKADYYTPRARPPVAEPGDGTTGTVTVSLNDGRRVNMPRQPGPTWVGIRGHGRMFLPSRFVAVNQGDTNQSVQPQVQQHDGQGGRRLGLFSRQRNQQRQQVQQQDGAASSTLPATATPAMQAQSAETHHESEPGRFAGVRSAFSGLRMPRRGDSATAGATVLAGGSSAVTPATLEAGTQRIEAR